VTTHSAIHRLRLGLGVISFASIVSCGGEASTNPVPVITYNVSMTGLKVRPEYIPGTVVGTGAFIRNGNTLSYAVTVSAPLSSPITGAHIHVGGAEGEGEVILDLARTGTQSGLVLNGAINVAALVGSGRTAIMGDSLMALLNSGNAYADIHTVNLPYGEIRSQIIRQ
jgi:hypothetical protein